MRGQVDAPRTGAATGLEERTYIGLMLSLNVNLSGHGRKHRRRTLQNTSLLTKTENSYHDSLFYFVFHPFDYLI